MMWIRHKMRIGQTGRRVLLGGVLVAAVAAPTTGMAADSIECTQANADAVIDRSFWPYKDGKPTIEGLDIEPGLVIDKNNVEQYKKALDPETYQALKAGTRPAIKVGPTDDLKMHPNYVEASHQNVGTVKEVDGNLEGYEVGRPFPCAPQADDPNAGKKIAWNFRHTYAAGEANRVRYPWIFRYKDLDTDTIERELQMQINFLTFKHRVVEEPKPEITPNPNNYYRQMYLKVFAPQDVKDTQLLLQLYEDDTKSHSGYIYLGFQRRVRRIDTGQTSDAFLGSDIMIQDFEGYFGPLSDIEWKYLGTEVKLMPVYRHTEQESYHPDFENLDGYKYIDFHGDTNCFLNVTWSLRRVHKVQGVPKDEGNPVGKRVHYIDSQSMVVPRTIIYDRAGKVWKPWSIAYTPSRFHLPQNKEKFGAVYDGFSMFDKQANHCTTGHFRTETGQKYSPPEMFTPQYLRNGGVKATGGLK